MESGEHGDGAIFDSSDIDRNGLFLPYVMWERGH